MFTSWMLQVYSSCKFCRRATIEFHLGSRLKVELSIKCLPHWDRYHSIGVCKYLSPDVNSLNAAGLIVKSSCEFCRRAEIEFHFGSRLQVEISMKCLPHWDRKHSNGVCICIHHRMLTLWMLRDVSSCKFCRRTEIELHPLSWLKVEFSITCLPHWKR